MTVEMPHGRHRRPKHRLIRTLATALLITLLVGAPTIAPTDRPTAYAATEER